jgi:hypothetical protein
LGFDRVYAVNEVIAALDELRGKVLRIAGVLEIEFEGDSIWHYPKSERLADHKSSLWVDFAHDALGRDRKGLKEFDGRRVVVTAMLGDHQGHFSLWPASAVVTAVVKC